MSGDEAYGRLAGGAPAGYPRGLDRSVLGGGREKKEERRREMTTAFGAEIFAGLPSGTWTTKEIQQPYLGLREGDLKEINLDSSSEAAHLSHGGTSTALARCLLEVTCLEMKTIPEKV